MDDYFVSIREKRAKLEELLGKLDVINKSEKQQVLSTVWSILEKSILVDNLSNSLVDVMHENKKLKNRVKELEGVISKLKEFLGKVEVDNVQKKM